MKSIYKVLSVLLLCTFFSVPNALAESEEVIEDQLVAEGLADSDSRAPAASCRAQAAEETGGNGCMSEPCNGRIWCARLYKNRGKIFSMRNNQRNRSKAEDKYSTTIGGDSSRSASKSSSNDINVKRLRKMSTRDTKKELNKLLDDGECTDELRAGYCKVDGKIVGMHKSRLKSYANKKGLSIRGNKLSAGSCARLAGHSRRTCFKGKNREKELAKKWSKAMNVRGMGKKCNVARKFLNYKFNDAASGSSVNPMNWLGKMSTAFKRTAHAESKGKFGSEINRKMYNDRGSKKQYVYMGPGGTCAGRKIYPCSLVTMKARPDVPSSCNAFKGYVMSKKRYKALTSKITKKHVKQLNAWHKKNPGYDPDFKTRDDVEVMGIEDINIVN